MSRTLWQYTDWGRALEAGWWLGAQRARCRCHGRSFGVPALHLAVGRHRRQAPRLPGYHPPSYRPCRSLTDSGAPGTPKQFFIPLSQPPLLLSRCCSRVLTFATARLASSPATCSYTRGHCSAVSPTTICKVEEMIMTLRACKGSGRLYKGVAAPLACSVREYSHRMFSIKQGLHKAMQGFRCTHQRFSDSSVSGACGLQAP